MPAGIFRGDAWTIVLAHEHARWHSPDVDIAVEILSSIEAISRLQAGTLDIGIIAMPHAPCAGVKIELWRNDPMVAIVPRSWKPPKFITPQWLAGQSWISFDPATQMFRLIATWFANAGLTPSPHMHLNYPEAIKRLVESGRAAAVLPFEPDDNTGRNRSYVQLRLLPDLTRPLGLAYRSVSTTDKAILSVLQALGEFSSR